MSGLALQAAGAAARNLPPLREELELEPGSTLRGGAPSWTLYDPVGNRFFRISWLEFEILCRWNLRGAPAIAERISSETALDVDAQDVETFAKFLDDAELLHRFGEEGTRQFVARKAARRHGWLTWLLHHYLFIRIPLLRPDRMLEALLPWLGWVYSRTFLVVTVTAALAGLYLVQRQWDTFISSLPWFFSMEGLALAGLALVGSKCLHELSHGMTAKRFGCQVPSMGVALLVLAPVLYTDTTAAWRLRERSRRLAIGSAGMAAECCLAAYALLLWSFLPDGIFRSIVFVWATTTWVLTVLINVSPFMRFDGYYLLSDFLDVPNLQDRAFALTRHWIRETLFDYGEPPPELWPSRMRRILIAYAVTTWIYRLVLFLGIAILVYHMFFKALGIVLFAVEMWWFIARPVVNELKGWIGRHRGRRLNRRSAITFVAIAVLLAALFIPWRSSVYGPALLGADTRVKLYTQIPGRVAAVHVAVGVGVNAGQDLIKFASPDIAYRLAQAQRTVDSLTAQIQSAAQEPDFRARAQVLAHELEGARSELKAVAIEHDRLTVRAPVAGTVVELAEPLGIGEWMKPGELLGFIIDASGARIDAYVEEAELDRIAVGDAAVFVPGDIGAPRVPARIAAIEETAIRTLADPELASLHGGAIATRAGPDQTIIPEVPVYRVKLVPATPVAPRRTVTGTVIIDGKSASIARRAWQRIVSVVIRESGF